MTPLPDAFLARLAAVQCREDSVAVAQLEAQGWEVAGGDVRYGSVWMVRPVRDEEPER